jgi:hypothetical protein
MLYIEKIMKIEMSIKNKVKKLNRVLKKNNESGEDLIRDIEKIEERRPSKEIERMKNIDPYHNII